MKNERYKDTDLREALRRKYADTPQLPAGFMNNMERKTNPPMTRPVRRCFIDNRYRGDNDADRREDADSSQGSGKDGTPTDVSCHNPRRA